MNLLNSVIGGLMGGGGASSPMGGALMNMLDGGGRQGGSQQSGGMTDGMGGAAGAGMTGSGLGGLMSSFEQAGLGHIAQSWVGNGPNQPVSPDQLGSVLGQDRVQNMAGQAGMGPHDFLSQLSQHLPNAVHGMTPDGQMPGAASETI